MKPVRMLAIVATLAFTAFAQEKSTNPKPASSRAGDMDRKFDSLFEASQKAGAAPAGAEEIETLPDGHPTVPVPGGGPGGGDPHGRAGMPSLLPEAGPDAASSVANVKALEAVPVLHEGRLKPMITYARHMLLQFSGRTTYKKQSAMQVMAKILFAPESSGEMAIFIINNPEVAEALRVDAPIFASEEVIQKHSSEELDRWLDNLRPEDFGRYDA